MTPNPGKVKSIVTIQAGQLRDRTSDEFILMRDKIFEIFNLKTDRTVEYYL
jgi:NitT/TauT family transport system ATP-binding protein